MHDHKFLFILGHPASGSTLLNLLLGTSELCSTFNLEGQFIRSVRSQLFTKDRWNPEKYIDWSFVKKNWMLKWDLMKPILVEKSPPNLVRALQIQKEFQNAYFIILVRNPYAYIEGARRRRNKNVPVDILAKRWVFFALKQMNNLKVLKRSILLRYEDLTDNKDMVTSKLEELLGQTINIDYNRTYSVFEKKSNIYNKNNEQIRQIDDSDLRIINSVLLKYKGVLKYYGYEIVKRDTSKSFFLVSYRCKKIYYSIITKVQKKHLIDIYVKDYLKNDIFYTKSQG